MENSAELLEPYYIFLKMNQKKNLMQQKKTIADFERESRTPQVRTLRDIQRTFEEAGVEFENDERGVGVKLILKIIS